MLSSFSYPDGDDIPSRYMFPPNQEYLQLNTEIFKRFKIIEDSFVLRRNQCVLGNLHICNIQENLAIRVIV